MKHVHTAADASEARLVRQLMEAEGLAVVVKGEYLDNLRGGIPLGEAMPTVWLLHEEDEARAREVLEAYCAGGAAAPAGAAWCCEGCGEEHPAQFGACWHCGTERP